MKKLFSRSVRHLFIPVLLMLTTHAQASHIIGAQLSYKWVAGPCSNTYLVTLVLYGDCSSTTASFPTLPAATPSICIYDGATLEPAASLIPTANPMVLSLPVPQCGTEVTPVCPDSLSFTTCTNISYSVPGIKKFVCSGIVTLPHPSTNWQFVYRGDNGGTRITYTCPGRIGTMTAAPAGSGRTDHITNLISPGTTTMQLIATLNNSVSNPRGHNSNPELTVEPTPFYCEAYLDAYNPGAIDLYDTNYVNEPSGDSLVFSLVSATDAGGGGCGTIGTSCSYLAPYSGANPLQLSGPLVFDPATGQMTFTPSAAQRSVVVYQVAEYINDTVGEMTTIAGVGPAGFAGDGSPANLAQLDRPSGICMDAAGNIYFADQVNNRIREINTAGVISTIAGTTFSGYTGDGGAAITARLNNPMGMASNAAGDLFIADMGNNVVRKISAAGIISTIAGNGVSGFSGDGGAAASGLCELSAPVAVFADGHGNIYIADQGNQRIRMVNAAGIISTLTGNGTAGYAGDGAAATATTAEVSNPYGIYVDGSNNIYFADAGNNRVREITAAGILTTVAGTGVAGWAGDDGKAIAAKLNGPTDVFMDKNRYLLVTDHQNNALRIIDTCGIINTIAGNELFGYSGDGSAPTLASVDSPIFSIRDQKLNIYIADYVNNRVREVVWNAIVNKTQVGTMEREMNFLVEACTYSSPGGKIDSSSGVGIHRIDSTHYYGCANNGDFVLYMNPTESDPTLDITVTATGLPAGIVLAVAGNNTPTPNATVTVNTNTIVPGAYTFYLTYTDNHCPLVGTNTIAFSVNILPVPTITDSLISAATCSEKAAYYLRPGGTGKPWTIKIAGPLPDTTTRQVFLADTASFVDSLVPGLNVATIFTSVSSQCSVADTINVTRDTFRITASLTNPDFCGGADGSIRLVGFTPGHPDTINYSYFGVAAPTIPFVVAADSSYTITGLPAGDYSSIIAKEGLCQTINSLGTVTLTNPPMLFRTVTTHNPTKCGFCDGADTLWGLHPGQMDTVTYTFTSPAGVTSPTVAISHTTASDSMIIIPGLCAGNYTNIIVNTAGNCRTSLTGPFRLDTIGIHARFDTSIHYGCNGDTVVFINNSIPAPDLTYKWFFGDGASSTAVNPTHVYNNITANTVTIRLYITNTQCVDSAIMTKTFDNNIHGGYTFTPGQFVCQDSVVTFTNTSTGTNPTYTWIFGDGVISNIPNPTHVYTNTGKYTIILVANENILPTPVAPDTYTQCFDSVKQTISVDSISEVSINATDSVLCQGEAITFAGYYSTIGNTSVTWSFGDGSTIVDVNPVLHAYDGAGGFSVTLAVKYRSCPSASYTRSVKVYSYPSIYMGPDLTICPGGNPVTLIDEHNQSNPKARWRWSTGDTTAGITIDNPGSYTNVVTIDGCSSGDTVEVLKDCYMNVPNVFSPNGDGTNDYFYPRQQLTKGLTTFKMDIYNRWGQLIYETTSIDGRGWDGAFNGQPQPEGVYVYMIDATYKDGQIEHHTGNITLIR